MTVHRSGLIRVFLAALLMSAIGPAADARQEPPPVVKPAEIVVLVDESGSINEADLAREREAAATIALGEYAPGSTVTVVGFASNDGPGQSAVDVVCPPVTVATAQDQQLLADCTGKLRKRGPKEGNGTDHVAALQQAMNHIGGAKPAGPRMFFLLTDGELDVSNSPAYGPDNAGNQRNLEAWRQVETTLAKARAAEVQIWPLGFGNVNKAALDRFAAGGFLGACGPKAPTPAATVVGAAADVDEQLLRAYSAARCAGISDLGRRELGPGGTEQISVRIPAIATDGSIVVVKRDPRIKVSFRDPRGQEARKSGDHDGSTFQSSGQNGPVEALRIVNPMPGEWVVTLTSFPGVSTVDVTAVVIWQGAVRAVLTVDPPSPQPDQVVTVSLKLQTRSQVITDQLSTLDFAVTMGGTAVPITDDGWQSDQKAGDGIYTGTARAPSTGKSVQFAGTVKGIGVSGDTRTYDAAISAGRAALTAQIKVDTVPTVEPGKEIRGTVTVGSLLGRAAKARLQVTEPGPGTKVSVPGADTVMDIAPTGTADFDFGLLFASDTQVGPNTMVLRVVDDADDSQVLTAFPFTVDVGYPSPPPPWWLYFGTPGLLALLVAFLLWFRTFRRARDVRGLAVYLFENGQSRGDVAAPEIAASGFRFAVRNDGHAVPYIDHVTSKLDPDGYVLTRVGGRLRVSTPHTGTKVFHLGDRLDIGMPLEIEVRDEHAVGDVSAEEPGIGSAAPPAPPDHHLL